MANITITVQDTCGKEKQIGLDDYVERWTWGVKSIGLLANDTSEVLELEEMQKRIKELAVNKFFKLYQEEQQKEAA